MGIDIITSNNSKSSFCNSYSILTSQPPLPFSDGQQLTVKDTWNMVDYVVSQLHEHNLNRKLGLLVSGICDSSVV